MRRSTAQLVTPLLLAAATAAALAPTAPAAAVAAQAGGGSAAADRRLVAEDEQDEAGPRTGAVDARYASPRAARETVRRGHRHGTSGPRPSAVSAADVDAPLDPATFGSWTRTSYDLPVRAIHATLLRTGKLLLIAGSGNEADEFTAGRFRAGVLDPSTGAYREVPPPYDMFCAGHAQLPNGNILVVGGTTEYATATSDWKGSRRVFEFDVAGERWIARPDMAGGRWYPTTIQSPRGDLYSVAGSDVDGSRNRRVERHDPATGTTTRTGRWSLPKYPGLLWTARDRIFYSGARSGGGSGTPGLYDPATGAFTAVPGVTDLEQRRAAATVFAGDAAQQRVLVLGGGWPATASTSVIDLKAATPVGAAGPQLPTAKAYVSAVNLPDGSVFQTGGATGRDTPVFESSLVRGGTVTPMAPNTVPRAYHSSALLLPDGRVMTLGGDPSDPSFELRVEVFSPPYLHRGGRPAISAAPRSALHGAEVALSATAPAGSALAQAWLVRPGSTTHSTDPNQRSVRLGAAAVSGGLKVRMPSRLLAPPGHYMLVVNDSLGRPSVARWIRLG